MARPKRDMDRRMVRYQAVCPDGGSGTLTSYALFDGISFSMVEAHSQTYAGLRGARPSSDAILVAHCRLGGMRLLLDGEPIAEVGEGQTVVVRADESRVSREFPNGFYRGANLRLSLRSLTLSSRHGMSEFGIDLKGLVASVEPNSARVLGDPVDMAHTFSELYNLLQADSPNLGYLRLKAFELLVLLQGTGPHGGLEDAAGSSLFVGRMQVAYRAQQVMTRRLRDPIGVEALAKQCEVSPTVLKESFRETFGVPVGTWYRSYRIHRACELLGRPDMPITEIARAVGYVSASKFSKAFSDVKGMTPSAWRRGFLEGACPCGCPCACRENDAIPDQAKEV